MKLVYRQHQHADIKHIYIGETSHVEDVKLTGPSYEDDGGHVNRASLAARERANFNSREMKKHHLLTTDTYSSTMRTHNIDLFIFILEFFVLAVRKAATWLSK